jgi:hypothetical protein
MIKSNHGWKALFFALLLAAAMPRMTLAQTGPDLLIKPWPREQIVEAEAQADFYNQTNTNNRANDGSGTRAKVGLSEEDSDGRLRLFPRDENVRADPRLGYNLTYLQLNTNDPHLPKHLTDDSIALGTGIADISGWEAGITVGVGYAGAGAFNDGNALYGQFDLLVGHDISKTSKIGVVLDYNGNRSFLPDVPLPGVVYTQTIDPTLLLAVGFPLATVTWTPDKAYTLDRQFTLDATYTIPDSFEVKADYAVIDSTGAAGKIAAFASFTNRLLPFHDNDEAVGRYRVFFEQNRAEVGVRWTPKPIVSLVVAGGYAFDQRFHYGWDSTNYSEIAKLGDALYTRVGLEFRY